MRKQYIVWQGEHENPAALPSLSQMKPSGVVKYFSAFLKDRRLKSNKILDIGCGKGRNALFLAQLGFDVFAFDYIESATKLCKELAQKRQLLINLKVASMDKKWPYPASFFDGALDCFSSIDIETKKGREKYRNELKKVLKPGGYAMVSVVSTEDELESVMLKENPGPERNSTVWPQNGKFQKDYDEDELLNFYKDFEVIEIKKVKKRKFKLGKYYNAVDYWLLLRK